MDRDLLGLLEESVIYLIGLLDLELDRDLVGLLETTEVDLDFMALLDLPELDLDLRGEGDLDLTDMFDAEDWGLLGGLLVGLFEDFLSFNCSSCHLLSLSSSCF